MRIKVEDGLAEIRMDMPVFIGTTGKNAGGFPQRFHPIGTTLHGFKFRPEKDDYGTLVFDHAEESQRRATSPTYFHYFWHSDKLIVQEGLDRRRLYHDFHIGDTAGLMYMAERVKHVYHSYQTFLMVPSRQVGIIDLLQFLEGKMNLAQLDARVLST